MERNKSDLLKEEKKYISQYDSDSTLREVEVKTKVTPFLYYIVIVASLSGFAVGYDTGVVGNALLMLAKDYNLNDVSKTMIVGATTLGGTVGSLGAGWLADYSGRKSAIYVAASFFVIGSLIMALSSTFTVLLISRFISGCGIGIGNMIATLYICEISPKFHRGVLVSCNMVLSNAALIISILTGILFESNGGGWRWMSAAASVIPLIQLFAVLFIPETPRFLVKKRDFEEARKVLSDIYPNSSNEFLDKEIEAIRSVIVEDTKVDRVGRRKLLLYTLFAAIIGLFLLGLAFVFISGFTIKQNTCSDYRNNCNACLGDGRCVFSKQNGGICVLKNNLNLSDAYDSCPNNHLNVFVICSLAFSLMTYAAGFGNVPWLLQSELLPLNIRGRGVGVSTETAGRSLEEIELNKY
ncbi:15308_t:CDS:2 [Gigaspora margarita]|uniref:15308_t:CDS:1 n=1 Tax=Gigaspora margarita TaxID=4874 RepID=A0ABN7VIC6_GIGMA|nr:15308_t:CDS:2 [Gigaspora margarita]